MRRMTLLLLAAGLLAIGGCAQPGTLPETSPPTGVTLPPLTVTRTGGIAGVTDTLQVEPGGAWTLTDRSGSATTGQLDAQAAGQIVQTLGAPGLDAEIATASAPNDCADQFRYLVRLSGREFTFDDCGQVGPLLRQLLDTLHTATGF